MKIITLFLIFALFIGCSKENNLIANYGLNGNLNDFAKANLAENFGNIKFIKTKNTKGLRFYNKLPLTYIKLPNITINPEEFTISSIVNFKDFTHNNTILFYGSKEETWSTSGLWIYTDKNKIAVVQEGQILSNKGYIHSKIKNNTFKNSSKLKLNQDYFLTIRYKNKTFDIFINDNLYASYKNVKPLKNKKREILIGIANDPKVSGKFQFNGIIDEIKIFKICLTDIEISNLINSYKK